MPWVVICQRIRAGCGRDQNKNYVNVLDSIRQLSLNAAAYVAANPEHPWADPLNNEYIIDIGDQLAEAIQSGAQTLFHDNLGSLPKLQNQTALSGDPFAPGSFADPQNDQSVFSAEVELTDDRWIIRLYDDDPLTTGVHIASLDLDEGSFTGEKTIYMRLFTAADNPANTNAQNQQTSIAGKLMIFDFTAGITTFGVKTTIAGSVTFPSNHRYRVVGPGGQKSVLFQIFGRTLSPSQD